MKIAHVVAWMTGIAVLLAIVSAAPAKYSGGTGEPNDPYQIATAADLIALGEEPNDYDKHFILTADIDLSDYDGKDGRPAFQVIGDCYTSSNGITTYVKGTPFVGIFDGNGKTIFHLTSLQANGNLLGLFGGLVGYNGGEMVGCFWDMQTSGQATSAGGTGKTTVEMQTAQTFLDAGWDFVGETANGTEDIWEIAEGTGYPRLSWEKYSGGTGGPNDPYQIAAAADLIALGETPDDYDKHFILTADIDLDPNLPGGRVFSGAVVAPDDDATNHYFRFHGASFGGVFDGKAHTISHLTIQGESYLGLFGQLASGAIVKNIGVVDTNVSGSGFGVACLAGANGGGSITACYGSGVVSGGDYVGGLIGWNWGDVTHCQSEGTVFGIGYRVGGLTGANGFDNLDDDAVVTCCCSTAAVTGFGLVGGLVGQNAGILRQCYSGGPVSGSEYVGGLAGSHALSRGGTAYVRDWACFWDTETSGQTASEGGTGLTTSQMQDINTFLRAGWDFVDETGNGTSQVWKMPQGGGYPVLATFNGYTLPRLQGMGTAEDPYLIHDAMELGAVFHHSPDAHYRLAASIDLSDICWGMAVIPRFCGMFDGNNLTISHLAVESRDDLGLFGRLESGAIVRNLGVVDVNITGSSGCSVGGLLGQSSGTVIQCYSTGVVRGRHRVGGLLGRNQGLTTASHSSVAVEGILHVGGLVGENDYGTVTQCYSRGLVSETGECVGGLVGGGDDANNIGSSFWDIDASGQGTSAGGIGKTTAQMQTAQTFLEAGWDFVDETANGTEDIWWIEEGQDYPRLWWEPRPAVRLPVIELDATTFDAGIAEGVVLVDFFATWCSHCMTQAPILEEVADRLEGKAQVAKLDIDKARNIAQQYGVTGVPTLILFRDGVEVQRFVGVTGADILVEAILAVVDSM